MKSYFAFFRLRFINSLQYRAAALAGVATQFAWGFMELLAFAAFYRAGSAAFPMGFSQTVSYIWLQQAFLALFMMWFFEEEIFAAIADGGIAYLLARPVDLYWRWSCQTVATRLAKATLRCLPILTVALFLPEPLRLHLPGSVAHFGLFLLSGALCLGVVIICAMLADFLAGSILPLPFFPAPFRAVAELLPFAAMQNMPLRIYSGHIAGIEALKGIGLQVFWLAALVLLGRRWLKSALGKVVVQGG